MAQRSEHYLAHAEMQARLARGETVIYHPPGGGKSQVFVKLSDLPSEGDLAKGDPAAEAAALAKIDSEIAAKLAERARLVTTAGPAASTESAASGESPAGGKGGRKSGAAAPGTEPPPDGAAAANKSDSAPPPGQP